MSPRETIYAALFAKLAASASFVTTSRRLKHWSDVATNQQPALYMAQKSEAAATTRGQPTRWTLSVDVYIYVRTDGGQTPGPLLNALLDAVTAAIAPDNAIENVQTLGGIVEHCWIEGSIETDEGTLGDQAVAIVPIYILAT